MFGGIVGNGRRQAWKIGDKLDFLVLLRLRTYRCAAYSAVVPGSMAQSQEVRCCLRGSFVGGYRVGNCLPSGNRRELVCTAKLAVAARL